MEKVRRLYHIKKYDMESVEKVRRLYHSYHNLLLGGRKHKIPKVHLPSPQAPHPSGLFTEKEKIFYQERPAGD